MNLCNLCALSSQEQVLNIYYHIPMCTDLIICIWERLCNCVCDRVSSFVSLWIAVPIYV